MAVHIRGFDFDDGSGGAVHVMCLSAWKFFWHSENKNETNPLPQ